jgi:ribosome maturation factor RimP
MSPATTRDDQLVPLIAPAVEGAGYDLEAVSVSSAGRRKLVRVVVDGDDGVSLDAIAVLSREIAAVLDVEVETMGQSAYTLEVTSPGVDRPLELPRHWRRATGRLVKAEVGSDPAATRPVEGRVLTADDDGVEFDVAGETRRLGYAELHRGRVQVEFSHPETSKKSGRDTHAGQKHGGGKQHKGKHPKGERAEHSDTEDSPTENSPTEDSHIEDSHTEHDQPTTDTPAKDIPAANGEDRP